MRLGKISMAAVVALAVSSTPVLAAAAPASKLSVAKSARAGASVDRKSEAAGGGVILGVLAAAAVIAGIVIIADGDDEPASN